MLTARFTEDSKYILSTADIPTWTENAPIVGESSIQRLDDLKRRREQEVVFLLAKLVLEKYFRQEGSQITDRPPEHRFDSEVQAWLFPQILPIARRWLNKCVIRKDNTFLQLLLLIQFAHNAADRIYHAIVASTTGQKTLKPILRPYDTLGSTRYVDFDTTRPTYETRPDRCHISHVVADTESWEQKMAQVLEELEEIVCYAKNQNLGFAIPYTIDGEEKNYYPDFLVRVQHGEEPLNLIIEVTGEKKKEKAAKWPRPGPYGCPPSITTAVMAVGPFWRSTTPGTPKTSSGPFWRPCRRLRFAHEAPLTKAIFVLQCNLM